MFRKKVFLKLYRLVLRDDLFVSIHLFSQQDFLSACAEIWQDGVDVACFARRVFETFWTLFREKSFLKWCGCKRKAGLCEIVWILFCRVRLFLFFSTETVWTDVASREGVLRLCGRCFTRRVIETLWALFHKKGF